MAAEALRIKADRILQFGGLNAAPEVEKVLKEALAVAKEQGALFWEHRIVASQAQLLRSQSRFEEAYGILFEVLARFSEGFDTAELVESQKLLDRLEVDLGRKSQDMDAIERIEG
jgi:hypothetical protein